MIKPTLRETFNECLGLLSEETESLVWMLDFDTNLTEEERTDFKQELLTYRVHQQNLSAFLETYKD